MKSRFLLYSFILLSLLFQVETVFSCQWINGHIQSSNHCPRPHSPTHSPEDDCKIIQEDAADFCCETSLRLIPWWTGTYGTIPDYGFVADPIRLPLALFIVTTVAYSPSQPPLAARETVPLDWLRGNGTYLITQRFRD